MNDPKHDAAQPKPNPAGEIYSPSPWPASETEVGQQDAARPPVTGEPDVLAQIDQYVVAAGALVVGRGRDGLTLTERAAQPKPTAAEGEWGQPVTRAEAARIMAERTPPPGPGRVPPTGAIRAAWRHAHPFYATTDVDERDAEFDRWLAEHDAQVLRDAARQGPVAGEIGWWDYLQARAARIAGEQP